MAVIVDWGGLQVVVMFIDSCMDDVTYVRDVEVCVERMICYITGCICYGCENFGLGYLHVDYVGLLRRRRGWENNIKMDLKEVERSAWSGLMWLSGRDKWCADAKNVINFASQKMREIL